MADSREKIYNPNIATMLIGCLLQDASLTYSTKYPLCTDDFCIDYQKVVFATIKNLNKRGNKTVDYIDIDQYLSKYEVQHEIFKDCGGTNNPQSFIDTAFDLGVIDNYEYYYNELRKLSCLRDYRDNGYNIEEFWDINDSQENNQAELDKVSIDNIIDYFDEIQVSMISKYRIDEDEKKKKFGDHALEIYQSFKDRPIIQTEFESKYLTTLWNGFGKKQLYIRSGDTSSGKSRSCVGDLMCVCADEIYDIYSGQWIPNLNGGNSGLYIGCEMDLDEEVETLLWAYISGVESSKIMHRKETKEESERVKKAIEITQRCHIYGADVPSFNIRKLEELIREHKRKYNISFVAFDYILLNSALVKEFVANRGGTGIGANGADILLELSQALKDLAKKYDVGIISATQTNADIKDYRNRDYQVIRGGKAISDKATGGSISMPITEQELKLVEPIISAWNKKNGKHFGDGLEPNFVETVYKGRFSEYPKECKIFSYYNLGNMRRVEMFVTDKNFKLIKDIPKTIVHKNK